MKHFIYYILALTLFDAKCLAKSWHELFKEKDQAIGTSWDLLEYQRYFYSVGYAPTIADPEIKSIPIIECGEELIDISMMAHPRIMMLPNAASCQPFSSPANNAGMPSASKIRKSLWQKLQTMLTYLDELAPEFGFAPGQISIKVFEGLRNLRNQALLFENKVTKIRQQNPSLTLEQAESEAAKWISPYKNNVPVHSTGAAIDIRLWDEYTHDFVDLGSFGVIWGPNPESPTFSEHITDAQKTKRLFLLLAAIKADLRNYPYEYWHFSYGDRYAAYLQECTPDKKTAIYGAIQ